MEVEKNKLETVEKSLDELNRKFDLFLSKKHPSILEVVDEEDGERETWGNTFSFILSCIGYAVGLGNIWRFPYLVYDNGGGAFLIPYVISLFCLGIPIFALEIWLGQFPSQGAMTCWGYAPIVTGVGFSSVLVSFFINIYYNMIMAWAIYYMFASFSWDLPWAGCAEPWATYLCRNITEHIDMICNQTDHVPLTTGICSMNGTNVGVWNTSLLSASNISQSQPSEDYFKRQVLRLTEGWHDMGGMYLDLTACLLAAWIITYICLIKGIQSSGKVVYFTALFPYVIMIALFIKGIGLPNARDGVAYFTKTDFSKLKSAKVWSAAASQIFYSLSAAMGGLQAMGSYNKFRYNFLRDTFIVSIINCLTSVFAGVIVFSYLGHISVAMNVDISKVVTSGPGLAFVVYPTALSLLPGSTIWSILFFFMIILLAIDSQFVGIEAVSTGLEDLFPRIFRNRKSYLNLAICGISFILGLSLCSGGGLYMLDLLNNYSGYWNMFVIFILECTSVVYIYGYNRMRKDLRLMLGSNPCGPMIIWEVTCAVMWGALSPGFAIFILVYSFVDWVPTVSEGYTFPMWADALGILLNVGTILVIVIVPFILVGCTDMTVRDLFKPTRGWGPAAIKYRREVNYVNDFVVDPYGDEEELAPTKRYIEEAKL